MPDSFTRLCLIAAIAFASVAAVTAGPHAAAAQAACEGGIAGTAASEKLTGTPADDRIVGGGGRDTIIALAGNDCVSGGPKEDHVEAGPGADRVVAGGGKDWVRLDDGAGDSADCGPGRDAVVADPADALTGCERVTRLGTEPSSPDPPSEPTPPADTTPPETSITAGPSGTIGSGSASFSFSGSEPGSTFECSLDSGGWAACTSPKALSGLANGAHTFSVRASDQAGNVDASPATRQFTVSVSAPTVPECAFAGVSSCTVLKRDDGTASDPRPLWGNNIYCADPTRHQVVNGYRRITVQDGDDVWGERCEIANNEHRNGMNGGSGTFALYREGERAITSMRVRLEENFPLSPSYWTWQVIAQMKQAQPSDNGGGTPILSLSATYGSWRLYRSSSATGTSSQSQELWSTPAQKGTWTRIAFDVTYSQDPTKGKVQMFIDANGDGDASDAGETSPVINTYTLKRETATNPADGLTDDGVAEGQSIPSHLRIGIYHDPALECPPPTGCSADYDDIVVARPN